MTRNLNGKLFKAAPVELQAFFYPIVEMARAAKASWATVLLGNRIGITFNTKFFRCSVYFEKNTGNIVVSNSSAASRIIAVPLADPRCTEKVLAALKSKADAGIAEAFLKVKTVQSMQDQLTEALALLDSALLDSDLAK